MFASKRNLIFILIAATVIAYLSSLGNPFIWDDEQFVTENSYVQQFDIGKIFTTSTTAGGGVQSNYYRPLTTLSFAIDTKIWGNTPFGFHLTNLALHIGAGIFLFLLLEELLKASHSGASAIESKKERSYLPDNASLGKAGPSLQLLQDDMKENASLLAAFFIALIFLVHPVQVEAVTYINSRGDSMYAFFLFLSLWLFASSLRGGPFNGTTKQSQRLPRPACQASDLAVAPMARNDVVKEIIIVALYIASILSKEIAMAAFPLYFGIILWNNFGKKLSQSIQLYTKGKIRGIRDIWAIGVSVTVAMIAVGYFFLRLTILNFGNTLNFYGTNNDYTTHLSIRLFTFAKVVWIYVGLLVWPYPLHMERTVDLVKSAASWEVIAAIAAIMVGVIGGIWEIKVRKTGWILFGLLWWGCMLIPGSGIIPINGILYEHWLYVPIVGIWIMAYGVWRMVLGVLGKLGLFGRKIPYAIRYLLYAVLSIAIVIYIVLTIRQNNIWSDPIEFYTYTLQFASWSARLHNNLGISYANRGEVDKAIPEYEKALALGQNYPQIYNNLGNAQLAAGDYNDAEKNLKKALQLAPGFGVAQVNLIKLYVAEKKWDKAEEEAGGNEELLRDIREIEGR